MRSHVGAFAIGGEATYMADPPLHHPLLVTFDEAAVLLSVSRRTVQRLVAAGKLQVVRLTADTPRIRYEDLESASAASDPRST